MLKGDVNSIPIHTFKGEKKIGLYQAGKENKKRVLARMVELPSWLSDTALELKKERKSLSNYLSSSTITSDSIGSRGHILINPKGVSVDYSAPLVGIDAEVYDQLTKLDVEAITFHVYCEGYERIERWIISISEFLNERIDVNPGGSFSRQFMVPISSLSRYANN